MRSRALRPGDYYVRTAGIVAPDGNGDWECLEITVYGFVAGPCSDEDLPLAYHDDFVSIVETATNTATATTSANPSTSTTESLRTQSTRRTSPSTLASRVRARDADRMDAGNRGPEIV